MQKFTRALTALCLGGLLFLLLLRPGAAMNGAREGLYLFGNAVLPALLPFFVLTSLLIQSGLLTGMRGLSFLPRLFCRARGHAGATMLLCLLAGAPTSSKLIGSLYEESALTRGEAARLCAAATLTGPLFLIGTVGALLGSPGLGAFVYLMQLTSSLLNGLVWRVYGDAPPNKRQRPSERPALSPFQALPLSLRDSCNSILLVGGAVCVFSALHHSLSDIGVFASIERAAGTLMAANAFGPLASGFLEVTIGCKDAATASLPLALRLSLLSAIASFGGFSILTQSACFLQGAVPMKVYFFQRMSHALLAFLLTRACVFLLSPYLPAIYAPALVPAIAGSSLPATVFALCLLTGWLSKGFEAISDRRRR